MVGIGESESHTWEASVIDSRPELTYEFQQCYYDSRLYAPPKHLVQRSQKFPESIT